MSIHKPVSQSAPNRTSKARVWAYLVLATFIAVTYLPIILQGGIIVDDWGDIHPTLSCQTFIECYRTWFPLFSNRPLAPLSITSMTMLFGTHFHCYLLLNSSIFILAIFITARVIRSISGDYSAFIFLALACIPAISLPIIVSPINQSTATIAFLYWALSLASLKKFIDTRSINYYVLSYLLLLCAFLTYEVILPLLALTATLPAILADKEEWRSAKKYFFQFLLPIFAILSLITLWQKGLAPNIFGVDFSRLALSSGSIYASINSWIDLFVNQIPRLFVTTKNFATPTAIIGSLLLAPGVVLAFSCNKQQKNRESKRLKLFFVSVLCFLSSSLIFILSGTTAESGGYQARGLSSTWLTCALLLSSIAGLLHKKIWRFSYLLIILIFGFFSALSFTIQRDGYIESWRIQNNILNDILELAEKVEIPKGATIIGIVPQFLSKNYNDEIVFSQPWDFGSALSILSNNHIINGFPIDPEYSQKKGLLVSQNGVKGTNWGGSDWKNLWLYRFDPNQKSGSLIRIQSENELKDSLVSLGYLEDFNNRPLVRPGQSILFSQPIVNGEKYIKDGWSNRESWGRWSNGNHARLVIPQPAESVRALNIIADGFITQNHPELVLKASLNGMPEKIYSINKVKNNVIAIPIPTSLKSSPNLTLDLTFVNPMSPKELDMGSDERRLGIGIKEAIFAR